MPPPEVGVVTVTPQRVALTTELPGRTSAYLVAEVRPQVGGIILKRLFTEGSDVKAGEVLYQIDPATYQAAYASAKAALSMAEANVVPVRLKAERYGQLVAINAVSKQDFDEVSAQLKQAEAQIESAKAALEMARINLRVYTDNGADLRPYRDVVRDDRGPRYREPGCASGDYTESGQGLCGRYPVGGGPPSAEAEHCPWTDEEGRRPGESEAHPGGRDAVMPLTGTLKFSDVTVDQSTGSVTVRTVFPNPKEVLLPGMYVRAILEEGVAENAILVPQQGVTRDQSGMRRPSW